MLERDGSIKQVYRIAGMLKNKYSVSLRFFTIFMVVAICTIFLPFPTRLSAQNVPSQIITEVSPGSTALSLQDVVNAVNNLWVLVAGILVLMMQLGFAMLEAGINASKNAVNVLFKNVADACVGILVYFVCGYALMYRPETCQAMEIPKVDWIASSYLLLNGGLCARQGAEHLSIYIDFFFQAAFAATAATICSGAVAGRIKPWAYLLLTGIITGLVYPVTGYWAWGGGWLSQLGFHDFAGSLVVHSVGGGAALAIVMILGSRTEFIEGDEENLCPHSLPLAAMGTFILWIGWYGFNAGSALGIAVDSAEVTADLVGKIVVNTTLSACASACTCIAYRMAMKSKIDLPTVLNGLLGGLVAITASCDVVSPLSSLIIGVFAGFVVIGSINLLAEYKIDDPVGAIPVHCFCGIWGGLATFCFADINAGVNADINFLGQITGSILIPLYSFGAIWIFFWWINSMFGIRVTADEEKNGLDWKKHGQYAYFSLEKKDED